MTQAEQNCRDRIIEWMDFYGISKDAKDRILDIVDEYAVISESEGYRRGVQELSAGIQEDRRRELARIREGR